ncbi:hypothetical protein R7F07_24085 [Vibrio sp. YT-16]|uniref:hypothetical protein n=1 Tax=Vibrio TaxID=662 RepID=UPI00148BBBEB|nr:MULTISPECIES: hypothetical protein [Vibrio]MDW1465578.1 hypothetical protein [Vibrio sp. YT-16]NOH90868.1 hypothetical protein [Vibrio alginolyticus]
MALNDDTRAASALMANLSGFIITANLSMLAVQGASYAFVATDSGETTCVYNVLSIIAFCCFVISILFGGKGITETASALADSSWTIKTATNKFNLQAIISFSGVITFLIASIFFTNKSEVENLNKNYLSELSTINLNLKEINETIKTVPVATVEGKLRVLEQKVVDLENKVFNVSPSTLCKVIDAKIDGEKLFCPIGFMFKGAEKHPSKNGTLDKIVCCK